jgi:hypothetical protein
VNLAVPIENGRYKLHGTITVPVGNSVALEGSLVLLEGGNSEHRAVTTAAVDGSFNFTNVPTDQYAVTVSTLNGISGSAFAALEGLTTADATVTVPLLTRQLVQRIPRFTKSVYLGVGCARVREFPDGGVVRSVSRRSSLHLPEERVAGHAIQFHLVPRWAHRRQW